MYCTASLMSTEHRVTLSRIIMINGYYLSSHSSIRGDIYLPFIVEQSSFILFLIRRVVLPFFKGLGRCFEGPTLRKYISNDSSFLSSSRVSFCLLTSSLAVRYYTSILAISIYCQGLILEALRAL